MSHINDMNDMKREVKKTANKAKYMAKEVAEDVKDNFVRTYQLIHLF